METYSSKFLTFFPTQNGDQSLTLNNYNNYEAQPQTKSVVARAEKTTEKKKIVCQKKFM